MTKKTQDKTATATATDGAREMLETTNEKVTEASKAISGLFQALTFGTRAAVEGVIAVDKALLGYAGEAAKSYADLGRQSVSAKSVSDLFDLHVAHAHDRIEQNAANTREVLELAQSKAKEAYTPVQVVLAPYMPNKKAA